MASPQTGFTVWLTGMSGSGKTTLAKYIGERLKALGRPHEVLESAEVEELFGRGLPETKEGRNLLVKRLGYSARMMTRAGGVAIVPALSPYRDARDQIRREVGRFVEVFVECPVDVLISKDTTGKYKKALSGEIPNFVGITDPYEPPQNPEVIVHTDKESVADSAMKIFQVLLDLAYLQPDDVKVLVGKKLAAQKKGKKKEPAEVIPKTIQSARLASKADKAAAKGAPEKGAKKARPAPAVRAAKDVKVAKKAK
jgi:adenylylsulfate kinase